MLHCWSESFKSYILRQTFFLNFTPMTHLFIPRKIIALCIAALCITTSSAHAVETPQLNCDLSYAGTTHHIKAGIIDNPYLAEIHDVGGRFSFKAVMLSSKGQLNTIKLYAYLQGRDKDFPIHEAIYLAPFPRSNNKKAIPLTPINHLYAGEVERELQYQCFLQWEKK